MWFRALGRRLVGIDAALQKRTKARRSLMGFAGVHGLVLTTRGRKSGQLRDSPLLYVKSDGGYVVAGSNWGGHTHPAWSANLLAEPRASVAVAGRDEAVRARLVRGEERDRLWNVLVDAWPAFRSYAKTAGRDIRVFLLSRDEE
ncbi:MAG TPA: nitroreductase/quinone reductase family protein [Pseudonocardiaceae bacterium]|jgi:deazaflavin-dependent oxidoreductase (nitroreductase family)|nr:nitroreductase/quinone reductase family protein [Pseudonocardiaceae bacterium]